MTAFSPFNRPYGTRILCHQAIPAMNRWATFTCPYGAHVGTRVPPRGRARTVVPIRRSRIFARSHMGINRFGRARAPGRGRLGPVCDPVAHVGTWPGLAKWCRAKWVRLGSHLARNRVFDSARAENWVRFVTFFSRFRLLPVQTRVPGARNPRVITSGARAARD